MKKEYVQLLIFLLFFIVSLVLGATSWIYRDKDLALICFFLSCITIALLHPFYED